MPAWRPRFECNKELFSASESCVLAAWSTAAFPGSKSVCNAWSDTHWQPAQTFPARLQRLQRQREIPANPPPPPSCLTLHFLIKALDLEGRGRKSSLGKQMSFNPLLKLFACLHLSVCFWVSYFVLPQLRCWPHSLRFKKVQWTFLVRFKRSLWGGFGSGFQLSVLCPSVFDALS